MAIVFGLLKGTPMECCPIFSIDGDTEIPIRNQTDEKLNSDNEGFDVDNMEKVDEMETLREQGFSEKEIKEMVWGDDDE